MKGKTQVKEQVDQITYLEMNLISLELLYKIKSQIKSFIANWR